MGVERRRTVDLVAIRTVEVRAGDIRSVSFSTACKYGKEERSERDGWAAPGGRDDEREKSSARRVDWEEGE
jgi:hypothetical protein